MIKLEIEKKNVDALLQTPTLDDYTTIKEYEDACVALGEKPICFENEAFIGDLDDDCDDYGFKVMNLPAHIIALIKLETISRALWGRNFQPKPDAEGPKAYYSPCFALYTKNEIEEMDDDKKGDVLSATTRFGDTAGFDSMYAVHRSLNAFTKLGFRLCQETEEKARYFGKQFIKLWAEYLKFNFEVEE